MMEQKLFWGTVVLIGIGVIMGALFPAGRDPFVPWSSAVAARGRNLFCMIEQNNARHKLATNGVTHKCIQTRWILLLVF